MRRLALLALWVAGCHFGVPSVEVDEGVMVDGGDDALDANVELGIQPLDANLLDFAKSFDFGRVVPDGALPGKIGFPCSLANDCDNGFCIDGYCCEELCDPFDPANQCRACNVPGSEGRCVNALDGTDPRGLCDPEDVSTCGRDGLCDGNGACRRWSGGTVCGPGTCSSGQVMAPPSCDGQGSCVAGSATANCAPYTCAASGGGCTQSCTAGGGCATGAICDSFGQCNSKAPLGGSCVNPGDCASGFCSQGVCCSTDCSGLCRSCALPGARGLCLFIAANTDPFNDCTSQTRASCALDGQCDGTGACRKWAAGTPCAPRSCNGDSTVAPRFCDGSGSCLPGAQMSCVPYTCEAATGVCFGQCSVDAQCSTGNQCKKKATCGP